jgi:hypothetical protein
MGPESVRFRQRAVATQPTVYRAFPMLAVETARESVSRVERDSASEQGSTPCARP